MKNLIRQARAATDKQVSRSAIAQALDRGDLTTKTVAGVRLVVEDELYRNFTATPGKKRPKTEKEAVKK